MIYTSNDAFTASVSRFAKKFGLVVLSRVSLAMCVRDSDSPVCLTPSSPLALPPGALVFYDVVDPHIVSRSRVLLCIAEAGGDARLPDAVTVSDFKIWMAAKLCPEDGEKY